MKRSRLLRSSFIVVSAAAVGSGAAAIACGSSTDASPTTTIAEGGGIDGNAPGCPATPPMFQDPCTGTLKCTYDGGVFTNACGTFPNVTTAECMLGNWGISMFGPPSCNPPRVFDAQTDAPAEAGDLDGGDGGD